MNKILQEKKNIPVGKKIINMEMDIELLINFLWFLVELIWWLAVLDCTLTSLKWWGQLIVRENVDLYFKSWGGLKFSLFSANFEVLTLKL